MVDHLSLRKSIGPLCSPLEPERVAAVTASLPAEKVKAIVEEERRRYRTSELPPETFERSVRLGLALEQVVKDKH